MKLAELSKATMGKIKFLRWDRILEKQEGQETWASVLQYYKPEFSSVGVDWVLLPVNASQHSHIRVLGQLPSADGRSLNLFLQDTTYERDWYNSGYLAFCDRLKNFWIAILYHEWFMIEPSLVFEPDV